MSNIENWLKFKPNKISYILLWGFGLLLLATFASIIAFSFLDFIWIDYIWIWVIWLSILSFLSYFWVSICYKKEEYILTDRKIIYNYWNIFSDNSVEVNIDKIVQVHAVLWFVQNLLFKTWTIFLQTAWSTTSSTILKNIDNPMKFYEIIQEKMRENGFHLTKDKLVQTAKPHWVGVIWEVFAKLFSVIILIIIFSTDLSSTFSIESNGTFLWLFYAVAILILGAILVFSYLDLKRRRYDVFTDSVFYTEWFLTKNYSFLPMESVSDVENYQSFWSKVLWLHDVIVSSEWANNKVTFKNMLDWEQVIKNIKYLKNSIIRKWKDEYKAEWNTENPKEVSVSDDIVWYKSKLETPLNYDKEFKGEYRMSMLKAIIVISPILILALPALFFPDFSFLSFGFVPLFVVLLISQIIRVSFTRFIISESNIDRRYEFLTNKHNSFSVEKITWVIIKESFVDKWCWTCSIVFWSIGSNFSIVFSWIKKTKDLEERILAKVWINKQEEFQDIPIKFSIWNYLKASIWVTIFVAFIALLPIIIEILIATMYEVRKEIFFTHLISILIYVLLFALIYLYKTIFYQKKRYIQRIHTNYIESINWIFFVDKYYSLFRHIKWLKSTKYPLTNVWTFVFDVAWELLVKQWNNPPRIISNSIKIPYVDNVKAVHNYVDNILNGKDLDSTILKTSKQAVSNSIFWVTILALVFIIPSVFLSLTEKWFLFITIPFIVFFAVMIGTIIWIIKVKFFTFEKQRVVYNYWIIYKSKQSILYNKINFIEKKVWLTNKIFRNGSVNVYTLWSWKVEMVLSDMDNYEEVYDLLKRD